MKRVLTGILTAALAVSLCAATAFAAGPRGGRYFVDADGDGICDNAGSRCVYLDVDKDGVCDICGAEHGSCPAGKGLAFVDADGDGICDSCGTYHWCGGNFVDADSDGVCDNYAAGQGRGCGCGSGFVDADGDGICDNYQSGQGRGCGGGRCGQGGRRNGFRGGRNR